MNSFTHIPVLLTEVLAALAPRAGGVYLDGTIGGAGHAVATLKASGPTGWLWGVDRDGAALTAARERLAPYAGRFELFQGSFDRMAEWVPAASCDGVLLDLGVSSPQIDEAERGFSFQADGPLDMRMDRTTGFTAEEVVNTWPVEDLMRIFAEWGEEPNARRVARVIGEERKVRPFRTTRELATMVERICPRHGARIHPATRVFQALRVCVNDELGQLDRGLDAASKVLRSGGRLVVITFHSLEVQRLRAFARVRTRDYEVEGEVDVPELRRPRAPEFRWVQRRGITPGPEELAGNPRSRSAQLRVLERMNHGA